jgi:hypothetical protein
LLLELRLHAAPTSLTRGLPADRHAGAALSVRRNIVLRDWLSRSGSTPTRESTARERPRMCGAARAGGSLGVGRGQGLMRKMFEVSGKPGDPIVVNFVVWFQLETTVLVGTPLELNLVLPILTAP